MAFLTALLAQNAGAADQKVKNYQNALSASQTSEMENARLAQQQREDDRRAAESDREFKRNQGLDAAAQAQVDRTNKADDVYQGVGLKPPPGLAHPLNHGHVFTDAQKADNAANLAAWYISQGAGGAADRVGKQATMYAGISNNNAKNDISRQKEAALEQYRTANLASVNSRFNSRQQASMQQFASRMQQRTDLALQSEKNRMGLAIFNGQEREYIAKMANAYREMGRGEDEAVRQAIAEYDAKSRTYDTQLRSLDPAVSGAAVAPTFIMPQQSPTAGMAPNVNVTMPNQESPASQLAAIYGLVQAMNGGKGGQQPPAQPKQQQNADPAAGDPVVSSDVQIIQGHLKAGAKLPDIERILNARSDRTPAQKAAILKRLGATAPLPVQPQAAAGAAIPNIPAFLQP